MIITKEINISGMHCSGCETIIEEIIMRNNGILSVKADHCKATVTVSFDTTKTDLTQIHEVCAASGYPCESSPNSAKRHSNIFLQPALALLSIFILLLFAKKAGHLLNLPEITSEASCSLVFITAYWPDCIVLACAAVFLSVIPLKIQSKAVQFFTRIYYIV